MQTADTPDVRASPARPTRVRYFILLALFLVSTISYADRATLAIAGPALSKSTGLDEIQMGYVLSAFAISYVLAQVPGGRLLDRFGSRWIYTIALALWSFFTFVQGFVGFLHGALAMVALFAMRFIVGLASAPVFPANARIAANWFPASERGFATAVFNASQYFSLAVFAPLMGWLVQAFSWPWVFYIMGIVGICAAIVFPLVIRSPLHHPLINRAELDHIEKGGALVRLESGRNTAGFTWHNVRQVIANRMLLGVYLGQYCVGVLTYFFVTWFPIYLVQQRGMSILHAGFMTAVPAICGFVGGLLGGVVSDWLVRRTGSLTIARKTPILIGMILATLIVACNYTSSQTLVIVFMSMAFFGKGLASLGWTIISDTSPREFIGVTGGIFNTASNLPGVVTPIVIGYIVARLGSFDWALVFVGAHCIVMIVAFFVVVQRIERLELKPVAT